MALDGVSLTEIKDKAAESEAESEEQDQTAHMCSLILLYNLRQINAWSGTVE